MHSSLSTSISLYEPKVSGSQRPEHHYDDDDDDDDPQEKKSYHSNKKSPSSSFRLTRIKSLFVLTPIRTRQLIVSVLFVANFFFIFWMVDGDPTQGELLRIEQIREATAREKSDVGSLPPSFGDVSSTILSTEASWCLEVAETRHQWRSVQRIAGPTFRQTIDICQTETPTMLFGADGIVDNDDDEEDERESGLWKGQLKMKREEEILGSRFENAETQHEGISSSSKHSKPFNAQCGVSYIHSQFTRGGTNTSWMIVPKFLEYFEASMLKSREGQETSEAIKTATDNDEHQQRQQLSSSVDIQKQRQNLHLACGARKAGHIGQLPLLHTLRHKAEIVDVALLHSSLTKNAEMALSRRYSHFRELEEHVRDQSLDEAGEQAQKTKKVEHGGKAKKQQLHEDEIFDRTLRRVTKGTLLGSPLLQTSALSAQYVAVHSCSTPAFTLATTTVATPAKKKNPGDDEDDETGAGNDDDDDGVSWKNEFVSWRLWKGGPLIAAAVCRAPPFKITIEVSPSSSWVEIIR